MPQHYLNAYRLHAAQAGHIPADAGLDHAGGHPLLPHHHVCTRRASDAHRTRPHGALGYGKFFRSDRIVGLEPIEAGRGPGQRTKVYVEQLATPIIASRSDGAILSDMVELPREITKIREQREL